MAGREQYILSKFGASFGVFQTSGVSFKVIYILRSHEHAGVGLQKAKIPSECGKRLIGRVNAPNKRREFE